MEESEKDRAIEFFGGGARGGRVTREMCLMVKQDMERGAGVGGAIDMARETFVPSLMTRGNEFKEEEPGPPVAQTT